MDAGWGDARMEQWGLNLWSLSPTTSGFISNKSVAVGQEHMLLSERQSVKYCCVKWQQAAARNCSWSSLLLAGRWHPIFWLLNVGVCGKKIKRNLFSVPANSSCCSCALPEPAELEPCKEGTGGGRTAQGSVLAIYNVCWRNLLYKPDVSMTVKSLAFLLRLSIHMPKCRRFLYRNIGLEGGLLAQQVQLLAFMGNRCPKNPKTHPLQALSCTTAKKYIMKTNQKYLTVWHNAGTMQGREKSCPSWHLFIWKTTFPPHLSMFILHFQWAFGNKFCFCWPNSVWVQWAINGKALQLISNLSSFQEQFSNTWDRFNMLEYTGGLRRWPFTWCSLQGDANHGIIVQAPSCLCKVYELGALWSWWGNRDQRCPRAN